MEPSVTKLSNGTRFNFQEHQVIITTQRVKLGADGMVTGELDIETSIPASPTDLYTGRTNFLSLSAKTQLITHLNKLIKDFPWPEIIETVFRRTVQSNRRNELLVEITSNDEVPDVEFFVWPFLQKDQPTTLFGDGASGKSYIALALAVAAKLNWDDNPLGLKINNDDGPAEVVWLDYETSKNDFTRRLKRITKGMDLGYCDIQYRRCNICIMDEIDELSLLVNQHNPGLIVIDSVGAACAGDLHGSIAPTLFFNAIRRFQGAKLLIFHSNKEQELYGNRFFWNFSRHVWEVKKQQVEGDNMISVGMFHRKANETKLFEPRAYDFIFDNEATRVERTDITEIPAMVSRLSMQQRIRSLLLQEAKSTEKIANELGESQNSVRTILNKHKNIFVKTENGHWGLLMNAGA